MSCPPELRLDAEWLGGRPCDAGAMPGPIASSTPTGRPSGPGTTLGFTWVRIYSMSGMSGAMGQSVSR